MLLQHGFLAGNNVYYVAGRLGSWDNDHETIGLTHPFYHDLRSISGSCRVSSNFTLNIFIRSRGTGIVYHEVFSESMSRKIF